RRSSDLAAAVHPVVRLFTAQPGPAKLILIKLLARFEAAPFFRLAANREGRAVDIGRTRPYASPTGACGTDVVIHLPARTQTVGFIRRPNVFNHLAPDGIAKIPQAVKRLQRAHFASETQSGRLGRARNFHGLPAAAPIDALLVPGVVRGWTGQTIPFFQVQRRQQVIQPAWAW